MSLKKKTTAQLWEREAELKNQMVTINDILEAEHRDMNDSEKQSWEELKIEREAIHREIVMRAMDGTADEARTAFEKLGKSSIVMTMTKERQDAAAEIRQAIQSNKGCSFELRANAPATGTADTPNSIGVIIQDMIEPLNKGLILYQLGMRIKTGLTQNVKYPIMPTFEANFVNEKEIVADTVIKDSALMPTPHRITISAPLTDLDNLQTEGKLYNWILNNLAVAIARTLNRWLLQSTPIATGIYGAMAYDASKNKIQSVSFAGDVPTYKELVAMRGKVLSTGAYQDGSFAYVMSGAMAATLEATRRFDSGDTPILVDGKIGGYPVLISEYIEAIGADTFNESPKHIGFGRWSDAIVGQFGSMKFTIDPYSASKAGVTNMVLDTHWSIDLIRKESFVIGTIAGE